MAVATSTAVMMGLGAATAGMQIAGGFASGKESDYNAKLYQEKAAQVDVQKRIEKQQYSRAKRQVAGTTIARTAKANIGFGGSPLAVFIDTQAQMEMDESIGQYNLEVEKRYNLAASDRYIQQGKRQRMGGIARGFTTLLSTGASMYSPKPSINTSGWKSLGSGPVYSI